MISHYDTLVLTGHAVNHTALGLGRRPLFVSGHGWFDMLNNTSTPKDPWRQQPTPLGLGAGDVHIWRARLEQPPGQVERLRRLLSGHEAHRAERFILGRDRTRFIVAHGILRLLLSRYVEDDPHRLHFEIGDAGKPYLASPDNHGLTFNMSHSVAVVLIVITRRRDVGIDVEHVRSIPEADAIVRRVFPPAQRRLYTVTPEVERECLFFRLWTRHEAYLKATGRGLSTTSSRAGSAGEESIHQQEMAQDWVILDLSPYPGYVGSVVVQGGDTRFQYLDYTPS